MEIVHELAMLPISKIVSHTSPIYKYCDFTGTSVKKLGDLINSGIWGYQLVVYLEIIEKKYGRKIRDRVRDYQLNAIEPDYAGVSMSAQGAGALSSLGMTMDLISETISSRQSRMTTNDVDMEIPAELMIARTLLQCDPASPYFSREVDVPDNDPAEERERIEAQFSRGLLLAAHEIRSEFIPVLRIMDLSEERSIS